MAVFRPADLRLPVFRLYFVAADFRLCIFSSGRFASLSEGSVRRFSMSEKKYSIRAKIWVGDISGIQRHSSVPRNFGTD